MFLIKYNDNNNNNNNHNYNHNIRYSIFWMQNIRSSWTIFPTKNRTTVVNGTSEADLEGARGTSFLFLQLLVFCDYFEELHLVFIEVKLIINKAPLTYVYPNTIKTYLILNHLLFSKQLLCYSKTTSAVIRNLTVLSSTADKINCIRNHFWHRWRH